MKYFFCILLFLAGSLCTAQQVGQIELKENAESGKKTETLHKKLDPKLAGCENLGVQMQDGWEIADKAPKISLKLMKLDKSKYAESEQIVADIELKNVGDTEFTVPFSLKAVEPDNKDGETRYTHGWLDLTLQWNGFKGFNTLKGEADLQGSDTAARSFLQLQPGQWITLRITKSLSCKYSDKSTCQRFETDGSAQLTARWHEAVFTRKVTDCTVINGTYWRHEAVSSPVTIDFIALPQKKSDKVSEKTN